MEAICVFNRNIYTKQGVILRPTHFNYAPVGVIIHVAYSFFPEDLDIWVTRGAEECKGGKPDSKHLICCAFDFRTRHWPKSINRKLIVSRMLVALGPQYYGYYKKYIDNGGNVVEWIHFQYNGGL